MLRMVFILCAVFVIIGLYQFNENIEKTGKLQEMKLLSSSEENAEVPSSLNSLAEISSDSSASKEDTLPETVSGQTGPEILAEYRELYSINPALVGWIKIEGTNIDYPVLRSSDTEFYLNHDFYGNEDKNGNPFVKDFADVDSPGDNFVVYAHNMKNGTMFGNLDNFENDSFAKEHSIIEFDTLYSKRRYQVISVFRSEVYSEDEDNNDKFKYYEYYDLNDHDRFDYFYENILSRSSFDSGIKASYGDKFITLSTCAYHTDNGRFVVVGKLISK